MFHVVQRLDSFQQIAAQKGTHKRARGGEAEEEEEEEKS
jgi:hypothetical protein